MTTETYLILENILHNNSKRDGTTNRQCHAEMAAAGFKVDLRQQSHGLEVFSLDGLELAIIYI